MDDDQGNHLKAYGLTFNALRDGNKAEWFINYRGGAFLLPDLSELKKREHFEKPSVRRKKKAIAARKRALKKLKKEGLL